MRRVTSTGLLSSAVFLLVTLVSDRQWLGSVGVGGRNTRPAERKCRVLGMSPVLRPGTHSQTQCSPSGQGRRVCGCLGAWRHIYRTCYCGQFRTRPGPQLLLADKPQDWPLETPTPAAGLSSGVLDWGCSQKSVTSCEWLFQIILISFLLSFHHTV